MKHQRSFYSSLFAAMVLFLLPGWAAAQTVTVSAAASPTTVAPGQSITFNVSVTSSTNASNLIVGLGIYNSGGSSIATGPFSSGQSFTAGTANQYPWTFAVPAGTATGTYTLVVGVWTAGYGNTLYWNTTVLSFSVSPAATSYTVTATASPTSVVAGQNLSFNVAVTANGSASNMIVGLGVDNASGSSIATGPFPSGQSFTAGTANHYPWTFTVPASTAPGSYTLVVGVWTANYAQGMYWNTSVLSFTVTAASAKTTYMNYFASLGNGHGVLNGAYVDIYANNGGNGANPLDIFLPAGVTNIANIIQGQSQQGNPSGINTGLAPAVLGFQLQISDVALGWPFPTYSSFTYIENAISAGFIPLLGGWTQNPTNVATQGGTISANNVLNVPSSAEYIAIHNFYQQLATFFLNVQQTYPNAMILYRPWVEPNLTGSFWWDRANFTPQQQAQLYVQEWTYMQTAGVHNLIWVFNANAGVKGYTDSYPGDQYVDLVSMDSYPIVPDTGNGNLNMGGMYAALTTAGTTVTGVSFTATKPVFFAEAGCTPGGDLVYNSCSWNNLLTSIVLPDLPKVFGIMTWFAGEQVGNQPNGAQSFMNNTITLKQLPPL